MANNFPSNPLPKWRAVGFDLDDTLFDRRAALARLMVKWLGATEAAGSMTEVLERDGCGQAVREEFHEWLAGRFPALGGDAKLVARHFRRDFPGCVRPDADTIRVLARLKAAGIKMAILSNGTEATQYAKLRACGAASYFPRHCVLISAAFGFPKPDPRAFGALAEALEIAPAEILFVGDDPRRDIAGAREAGLPTCRLRRPGRCPCEPEADMVIDSLADLLSLPRLPK